MQTEQGRIVGRVIQLNKKSGWGFISSKEIQFTRIFFHWTALVSSTLPFMQLHTGMWVEFTPIQIPDKGWRAIHIKVMEKLSDESAPTNVSTLSE